MGKEIDYNAVTSLNDMRGRSNGSPLDSDLFYDDMGSTIEFSNAEGFGFWCGKKCADKKLSSGQAPKFGKARKDFLATQAAKQQASQIAMANKDDGTTQQVLDSLKTDNTSTGGKKSDTKDNTLLYAGIGGTVIILLIIGAVALKK